MASWIETKLRGRDYFEQRREAAAGTLITALSQREDGWNFWSGSIGPFRFDASHSVIPISLMIDSGAWRSYRQRQELAAYQRLAGQQGFDFRVIAADDVLADVEAVIDRLGIYGYSV